MTIPTMRSKRTRHGQRAITESMGNTRTMLASKNALRIAAECGCDPRTAHRALNEGVDSIRTLYVREAIVAAAAKLGIALPHARKARR